LTIAIVGWSERFYHSLYLW